MKKKIVILVTVLMVLAVSIFAQTANSGDDFTIKQNAQGNITITGYTGSSTQVVIPETIEGIQVTEIASRAFAIGRPVAGISPNERMVSFYSRMNPEPEIIAINSIVIPNTVIIIGDQAFFGQSLMSVTLSTSLTTIGDSAFSDNQLTSVTIPNSVTRIGKNAFENNSLTSVTIPNSITEINEGTFRKNQLVSITIPNSITVIGADAFADNSLTTVTFGNRIETLDERAFADNKLTEITLPASLKTLYEDLALPYDISPNDIPRYSRGTFRGNGIQAFTIPANAKFSIYWIGNNFPDFYQSQNRKAGTYTWSGRIWTVQ